MDLKFIDILFSQCIKTENYYEILFPKIKPNDKNDKILSWEIRYCFEIFFKNLEWFLMLLLFRGREQLEDVDIKRKFTLILLEIWTSLQLLS